LRQTKTTFVAFNGPNPSAYLANNLLTEPYTTQVLNGSSGQMALTQYNYDESALASSGLGSAEQHDTAPPAGTYRGNQTSILRWLNSGTLTCQNGHSAGTGSNVTSKITYFDTGTIQTSADPCGNTTTFAYSNTYWGTYATTVTSPLSQITSHAYDFNTGLVTSTTDPNNLVTSYTYDSMWRVASVTHPDGSTETINHQESSFPFTATHNTQINTTATKSETSVFDGLGRVSQHQLSDPQGTDYIDTTYDALGRVSTVSNPHRTCGTDITSSCGTTTYGYDALSRKTSETYPPVGSVLQTAYCGASTLVTDPTKRWRRSRVDGLGRLVEVDEPNSATATVSSTGCPGTGEAIWITTYTMDALGNLTNVLQNGSHARSFTYDSLSRLQCSSNPETATAACPTFGATTFPAGTLTYVYNPDGVVLKKTDARNLSTNYTYEALHRELTRTYSDGTPTVTTAYDQTGCLGLSACHNVGHRTSMTDGVGSESWAYQVDKTNSRSVHVEQRTTNTLTKTSTYYLDLAGNITQLVYPTGRIVNYTYDSADRPSSAIDSSNGITYATGFQTSPGGSCLANVTCYTPQGSVYAVSLGQTSVFTGLNITDSYNSRLQPVEFKASSTGGNAIDTTYSYVDPVKGGNAGHVFSTTNNLNSSRTQTFTYDQVNRITSAGAFATTGPYCWGYQYSYDAWGNLTSQAGWTPNYTGCTQTVMAAVTADGNNHISAFSYDAAGNATGETGFAYNWDAESQLKSAGGVNYAYDGDGRRVAKVGSKLYWYGSGSEILAETDASGNTQNEYVFFGGKRIALLPVGSTPQYYVEDSLGSSRIITSNTGVVCYDADFYPFGGERPVTNSCTQNSYKFEGKERDTETQNDEFGARYYSWRFGRWLSADWSNVPVAVPYANLTNPQTLNLYSIVADDPESFADLDGHDGTDVIKWTAVLDGAVPELAPIITGIAGGYLLGQAIWDNRGAIGDTLSGAGGGGGQYGDFSRQLKIPDVHSNENTSDSKPGTLGKADHQQTVKEEAEKMGGKPEVQVETPGGEKGSRRIDAAKKDENGNVTEATQVIRPNKNGTPPAREVRAANDIEKATGVKPKLVPVRPVTPSPKLKPEPNQ
jgi:RHS repeat-associated protein